MMSALTQVRVKVSLRFFSIYITLPKTEFIKQVEWKEDIATLYKLSHNKHSKDLEHK